MHFVCRMHGQLISNIVIINFQSIEIFHFFYFESNERFCGKIQVFEAAANSSCRLMIFTSSNSFEWSISIVFPSAEFISKQSTTKLRRPTNSVHIPCIPYSILRTTKYGLFTICTFCVLFTWKGRTLFFLFIRSFVRCVFRLLVFQFWSVLFKNVWFCFWTSGNNDNSQTRHSNTLEHTKCWLLFIAFHSNDVIYFVIFWCMNVRESLSS